MPSVSVAATRLATLPRWKHVEIAAQVTLVVGVAPEEGGHARQRLGHHQLAHLVNHGLALLIPRLDTHAQQTALHFTSHHRQVAQTAHISASIGAAGNIAPPNSRREQA